MITLEELFLQKAYHEKSQQKCEDFCLANIRWTVCETQF